MKDQILEIEKMVMKLGNKDIGWVCPNFGADKNAIVKKLQALRKEVVNNEK